MSRKQRVLVVLPLLSGGGAEKVSLNIFKSLFEREWPVELLLFNKSGNFSEQLNENNLVHNLRTNRLRHSIFPMIREIKKIRPNIIFSSHGYVNLALILLKPFLSFKTQIWIREANLPSISLKFNPYSKLMWLGYRLLYRRSNIIICSSDRMKREFTQSFNVPPNRIRVLPNPVDVQNIRTKANSALRREGIGPRFVSAGRLSYQKGFDRLLYWFAKLDDKTAMLDIFGDGDMKAELMKLINKLELSESVTIHSFAEDLSSWIGGADCFLLSSRWEGMPNVALESLACGTPVIATKESGGIAELAEQAVSGSVTVAENQEEFISAMQSVKPGNTLELRKSLLPERYEVESVVNTLEEWMKNEKGG